MGSAEISTIYRAIGCHRCDAEAGVRVGREFLCGSCAVENLRTASPPPVVLCDVCRRDSTLRLEDRFLCGPCALALLCMEAEAEPDVLEGFASAIGAAAEGRREPVLAWVWELGRLTREGKLSVADASAMYHRALADAAGRTETVATLLDAASLLFGSYAASVDGQLAGMADETKAIRKQAVGLKRFADQVTAERDEAIVRLRRAERERRSLVRHLTGAKEEERGRIAEEIHDDTVQTLVAVQMRLQALGRGESAGERKDAVQDLERVTSTAIGRLRRLMFELRPDLLEHYGLVGTLREYLGRTEQHHGLRFRLDDRLGYEPPSDVRANVYRIVQEAVANVRKHAEASGVQVRLEDRDGGIMVLVKDDGSGFEVSSPPGVEHLGMRLMRERAERSGGWLEVSSAPGAGTEVTSWIPARPEGASAGAA
jgi:signal transduction histidine kinase